MEKQLMFYPANGILPNSERTTDTLNNVTPS